MELSDQRSVKMHNNPFVIDMLEHLKSNPQGVKIYDLLAVMNADLLNQLVGDQDYNVVIFRKNFWMMNALYRLQEALFKDQLYLSIGQVDVKIQPMTNSGRAALAESRDRKLRDYYFNWDNYQNTGAEEVAALLKSFWDGFCSSDRIDQAFAVLGVNAQWAWPDIRTRYRTLAREHHPDKGGHTEKFIEIREAYEVLLNYYQK